MLVHALAFVLTAQATGQKWLDQTFLNGVTFSTPVALKKYDLSKSKKAPGVETMEIWTGTDKGTTYFMETFKPPMGSKDNTATILSGFLSGLQESHKGDIDGEKNLLLQGWPGVAVTTVGPTGLTIATRCYFVNGWVLESSCAFATALPRPASCDQFLNSVHLPKDGTMKATGPVLYRYPLGDSGISVVLPSEPEESDFTAHAWGTSVKTRNYGSEYCYRIFVAGYFSLPASTKDPSASDVSEFYKKIADEATGEMGATKVSDKEISVGDDKALLREVSMPHGMGGSMEFVYHKRQCVMMMIFGPKAYKDPDTVNGFLNSILFGK